MAKAMQITGHDNRGVATAPFGYIYFTRNGSGWRVGYASSKGIFGADRTPSDLKLGEISALIAYAEKHKLASGLMHEEMV